VKNLLQITLQLPNWAQIRIPFVSKMAMARMGMVKPMGNMPKMEGKF
jgi:hypothetical protein